MMRSLVLILAVLFSSSLFAAGHDLSPSAELAPVVTGNGAGFMAAWTEYAENRNRVVSQGVSAGGELIEGTRTEVDQAAGIQSIAIAHSPTDTLVVWISGGIVYAERLSPSGTPVRTLFLAAGNYPLYDVAVAWNGSRYFVIWSNTIDLIGAFVGPDGPPSPPRKFFTAPGPLFRIPMQPDVAWDGQHFIVVFGERPNYVCPFECPAPDPDQFSVMRVSTDGDSVDSAPLIIRGSHLRAHVASSGAESLIVLDSRGDVSTIIAHDQSGLTVDEEKPLFRWFSAVSSAVVWDGAMYTVASRYVGARMSWTGATSMTPSGVRLDHRVTATGPLDFEWLGQPSIAVNDAGLAAFTILEASLPPSPWRARFYSASELSPMPAPPPAPRNASGRFDGRTSLINWESDGDAGGFAIEAWDVHDNRWYVYESVPPDARSAIAYLGNGTLIRVRAFGPGGVSEGTITSIGSTQRRRAVR